MTKLITDNFADALCALMEEHNIDGCNIVVYADKDNSMDGTDLVISSASNDLKQVVPANGKVIEETLFSTGNINKKGLN